MFIILMDSLIKFISIDWLTERCKIQKIYLLALNGWEYKIES